MTPREVAASQYLRTRGMSRRVWGYGPEQTEELRRQRVAELARALRLLRAANGSPRFLATEWDDADLERAAVAVEAQLDTETSQMAAPA